MRRYIILLSAVVMQMCLGATYSWSVYVEPIKHLTGLQQGTVQLPFSIFYFAFPATMVWTGSLVDRLGPRICAVSGAVVFGGGWMLAGLGHDHFVFTIIGIGLMAGIGVGFAYIVPIATCVRWFPEHKGLVTGIAVAGFGGGAALVSHLAGQMMHGWALSPFDTFAWFGIGFAVIVGAAGWTMANPPGTTVHRGVRMPVAAIVRQPAFAILYLAMMVGLAAGFAVNANLKELFGSAGVAIGITAVSLFAIFNAVGRMMWGYLFDRQTGTGVIVANLIGQSLIFILAPWLLSTPAGFLGFAAATGLNYGGVLVLYASTTARLWGSANVGRIYGWMFSANIPAAVSPVLAGYSFDAFGNFSLALNTLSVLLLAAAILVFSSRAKIEKQAA